MISLKRPFLIIPRLIEQPTWGGDSITKLKNWSDSHALQGKKIGQSYELYSKSKLLINILDTDYNRFSPEISSADQVVTNKQDFHLVEGRDYITFANLVKTSSQQLLIKINQAFGNSFQLHIKPSVNHPRWKPKAESWYYFEDGLLTFGIKKGIDINNFKKTCHAIHSKMKELSMKVIAKEMLLESAKQEAKGFIDNLNPWQFVNTHKVKKDSIIDLSSGGLHHSWEEDRAHFTLGNVVYEVQQDVMDPVCTVRSFDQGKFKSDGSIREIHIDDYFQFLDTDPEHNDIQNAMQTRKDNRLLTTNYYSMDILEVKGTIQESTGNSFSHLFVREGAIEVIASEGHVRVGTGHSCLLPREVGAYTIESVTPSAVVLKTFVHI